MFNTQTIRFHKNSFLFNQVRRWLSLLLNLMLLMLRLLSTLQPMHTCIWFCFLMHVIETLKYFLNSFSPDGSEDNARMIWLLLVGVQITKDGSSFIMIQKSCFITTIRLNLASTIGVRKKVQKMRSRSHVTKKFVANVGWKVGGCMC